VKTRTIIRTGFLTVLLLLLGHACTGDHNSPAATRRAKAQANAKAVASKMESLVPKVVTTPLGDIKITGSQSGTVRVPAKQGGYLIKSRYKGSGLKLEVDSAIGKLNIIPRGQTPDSSGWTEFEDLTSVTGNGEQQYRITAAEPFEIEFRQLPLPVSTDRLPRSYSGSGLKVLGPVSLKAGSALFKVSCPDLRQAGFIAELYDARTARNKGIIALGTGTRVVEAKKLKLPGAGDYLVKINADGRSEWTIEISQ
jgi:hypothetical protein